MIVTFTGARNGMTPAQLQAFESRMASLSFNEFRHGASPGADAQAVAVVRRLHPACCIVAYPGRDARDWAVVTAPEALTASNITRPPMSHYARNREMVAGCDRVIAAVPTEEEVSRSGTWYTVRQAQRAGVLTVVLFPSGRVIEE